jgi:hypothetical protein
MAIVKIESTSLPIRLTPIPTRSNVLVFANLKTWINGIHHGVSAKHLQAYLNEFTFRFYPFNSFRSLLGIAGGAAAPTFDGLYSGEWTHPTFSGCG